MIEALLRPHSQTLIARIFFSTDFLPIHFYRLLGRTPVSFALACPLNGRLAYCVDLFCNLQRGINKDEWD